MNMATTSFFSQYGAIPAPNDGLETPPMLSYQQWYSAIGHFQYYQLRKPLEEDQKLMMRFVQYSESLDFTRDSRMLGCVWQALSHCSELWDDLELWKSGISLCNAAHKVKSVVRRFNIFYGWKRFGAARVQDFSAETVREMASNAERLEIIQELAVIPMCDVIDETTQQEALPWCREQGDYALKNLRPIGPGDITLLVDAATAGGDDVVFDIVFLQLVTLSSSDPEPVHAFDLFEKLCEKMSASPRLPAAIELTLGPLVANMKVFPMMKDSSWGRPWRSRAVYPEYVPDLYQIERIIDLCIKHGASDALKSYFTRMEMEFKQTEFIPRRFEYITVFIFRFIPQAMRIVLRTPWRNVATPYLRMVGDAFTDVLNREDLGFLPEYMSRLVSGILYSEDGGISLLKEKYLLSNFILWQQGLRIGFSPSRLLPVVSNLEQHYYPTYSQNISQLLVQLHTRSLASSTQLPLDPDATEALHNLIGKMAELMINSVVLDSGPKDWKRHWISSHGDWRYPASCLLQYCFKFGDHSSRLCEMVLKRWLEPRENIKNYVGVDLFSLVTNSGLHDCLRQHNHDFLHEPFRSFGAAVVKLYLQYVLGDKPADLMPVTVYCLVGCGSAGCASCLELHTFLLGPEQTKPFRYREKVRRHLEAQLKPLPVGITTRTETSGSPHTLWVEKQEWVIARAQWEQRRQECTRLLAMLATKDQLHQVLLEEYASTLIWLEIPVDGGSSKSILGPAAAVIAVNVTSSIHQLTKVGALSNAVVHRPPIASPAAVPPTVNLPNHLPSSTMSSDINPQKPNAGPLVPSKSRPTPLLPPLSSTSVASTIRKSLPVKTPNTTVNANAGNVDLHGQHPGSLQKVPVIPAKAPKLAPSQSGSKVSIVDVHSTHAVTQSTTPVMSIPTAPMTSASGPLFKSSPPPPTPLPIARLAPASPKQIPATRGQGRKVPESVRVIPTSVPSPSASRVEADAGTDGVPATVFASRNDDQSSPVPSTPPKTLKRQRGASHSSLGTRTMMRHTSARDATAKQRATSNKRPPLAIAPKRQRMIMEVVITYNPKRLSKRVKFADGSDQES